MITMMYLVYTAMLALNVSAEVVSGFKTVGNAMTKSNENLQTKIDDTYANFEQALKNSPEKVQDKYNKALEVKKLSIELENYIDSITYTFVGMLESKAKIYADPENPKKLTAEIDFKDANGNTSLDSVKRAMQLGGFSWISKLDNNHKGTAYFLGKAEGDHPQTGEIPKLIERIHEYKHKVNELLGEDSTHVTLGLDVDRFEVSSDKKSKSWEQLNFNNTVAGAALVTLTRLKAETMNAEFDVVNRLYKQVSLGDFSFDEVAIISRPKSTYIIQGGTFETRFNVAAYDSKQGFKATIGGREYESADSGAIKYTTVCNTLGQQKITGTAYVQSPEGGIKEYPLSESYFVAKPIGVLMLDKMQVVYAGVDNPITVSVPGVEGRNITANIDGGGALTKIEGDGNYNLKPNGSTKEINIKIDAKIDGKVQNMGTKKVRVKPIPTPVIKLAGYKTGDRVSKKQLTDGSRIIAGRPDGFDFELAPGSMKVTAVQVYISNKPYDGVDKITGEMASAIRKANKGDMVNIDATVQMPDGKPVHAYCAITLKN